MEQPIPAVDVDEDDPLGFQKEKLEGLADGVFGSHVEKAPSSEAKEAEQLQLEIAVPVTEESVTESTNTPMEAPSIVHTESNPSRIVNPLETGSLSVGEEINLLRSDSMHIPSAEKLFNGDIVSSLGNSTNSLLVPVALPATADATPELSENVQSEAAVRPFDDTTEVSENHNQTKQFDTEVEPSTKRKQEEFEISVVKPSEVIAVGAVHETQAMKSHEEDDETQGASTAGSTATGGPKKISAKELVQHVKNQKKKIQEKEAEVEILKTTLRLSRMRTLAICIDLVGRAKIRQGKIHAFHKWLAFADRESAAVEVERVAGLAHRASSELEAIKVQLEKVSKEKAEQETAQKKLRVLLAKAKQQMAEQNKVQEQLPEGFTFEDVLRKTRGPDGKIWCLIQIRSQGKSEAAAPKPTLSYEWREEAFVGNWLAQHPTTPMGSERLVQEKPTIEDELQDRYSRASAELESALAEKHLELDALTDRFEQYRRRAELALEKAESSHQVHDAEAETALKEELSRVYRERDALATRMEELRMRLDTSESSLSALRLREKSLRDERDDFERRASEANRALDVARVAWEQSLAQCALDHETRLRAERNETRALEQRAEELERQLSQAIQREGELKELERSSQERLARADDRIHTLEAAVTRAEAKANNAEISRHLILPTSSSSSPTMATEKAPSSVAGVPAANRVSSSLALSSLTSPRNLIRHGSAHEALPEGDSASVLESTSRVRRDSENSEISFAGGGSATEMGSRYFVEQLGTLRAAHRNERTEWMRERAVLRGQIDEAVERKRFAEEKVADSEKKVVDLQLSIERQKQLTESARTIGETPDGLLYLKNAVFRFITADEDSERETLLPVITMLLKFSPEEVQVLSREATRSEQNGTGSLLGGFLSRWSS